MQAELTEHLGYEKHAPSGKNSGNSRNGGYNKTITGDFGNLDSGFFQIDFLGAFAGSVGEGLFVAEDDFLNVLGPASHRLTKATLEHVDDALGEVRASGQALKISAGIAGFDTA